jgi:hypothetical protein
MQFSAAANEAAAAGLPLIPTVSVRLPVLQNRALPCKPVYTAWRLEPRPTRSERVLEPRPTRSERVHVLRVSRSSLLGSEASSLLPPGALAGVQHWELLCWSLVGASEVLCGSWVGATLQELGRSFSAGAGTLLGRSYSAGVL